MHIPALDNLIASLEMSSDIFAGLIHDVPESDLGIKRRAGFWSVQHHVFHLADVQQLMLKRLVMFKNEKNPVITPFIPKKDDPGTPVYGSVSEALAVFMELRRRQIEVIRSMDDADMKKQGTHPEYKTYSLPILMRHILMHDYWHMYRIEELWLTVDEYLSE